MRFKLDENLGRSALAAFEAAGHDVSSIHLQALDGAPGIPGPLPLNQAAPSRYA